MSSYIAAIRYFYSLRKRLHLKKDELSEFQCKQLRSVVHYAYGKVPFYKKKFDSIHLKPNEIQTIDDLKKLPILTKNEIRKNLKDLISTDYDASMLRTLSTSGSTGQPLHTYVSKNEDSYRKAKHLRANTVCGHKPLDSWLTITSPSHFSEVHGIQQKLGVYSPKFVSVFWDLDEQIAALQKIKPSILDGYSSSLTILAKEIKNRAIKTPKPKMAFGGAELIDEESRKIIEDTFNAPFYDQYATIEFERMAWQCPSKSCYHIDADSLIMEFLDTNGEKVSSNEKGEIVCTSLFNYAMPLLRYSIGDIGVPTDEKCPCGITLPMLKSIEGRRDSILHLPNGRMLSPRAFTIAMGQFHLRDHINQYAVTQQKIDQFLIEIKLENSEENAALLEKELHAHFSKALGYEKNEIKFIFKFTNNLSLGKNGKFTIVKSEV